MKSNLERLTETLGIKITSQYGGVDTPDDWPRGTHPYKVTLRFQKRQLTVPFFMGPANEKEPTVADVLYCLAIDARAGEDDSFADFCSNMGYDTDSRKAMDTWKACVTMAPRLRRFLGDSFDAVAEAEH